MEDDSAQEEIKIRRLITEYVAHSPYKLNPDTKIVDRIVKGLVTRKMKFGYADCPCRLVTGDRERDKKLFALAFIMEKRLSATENVTANFS